MVGCAEKRKEGRGVGGERGVRQGRNRPSIGPPFFAAEMPHMRGQEPGLADRKRDFSCRLDYVRIHATVFLSTMCTP